MTATTIARALVLGGNRFPFHRLETTGPLLADALSAAGVDADATTDRDALLSLAEYDLIVDYTTDSTFTDAQLEGLCSFVAAGGGYLGVHCAADLTTTATDDPDELMTDRGDPVPELRELVGGHFLDHPSRAASA